MGTTAAEKKFEDRRGQTLRARYHVLFDTHELPVSHSFDVAEERPV